MKGAVLPAKFAAANPYVRFACGSPFVRTLLALCAMTAVGRNSALATEPIVVGTGETLVTNVAEDVENGAAVQVGDRAVIRKEGSGTWTLPRGTFVRNLPAKVEVAEGAVAVTDSPQELVSYPEPSEILARALWHVDASVTGSLRFKAGDATAVDEWLDVRETGDGTAENPYTYVRAVTNFQASLNAPTLTTFKGKVGVFFGGSKKGVWMNWVKPDGTQASCGNLWHVFIVHGNAGSDWASPLGQRRGQSPYFQRGNNIWICHNFENWPMHASRTYYDGVEIDPFTSTYKADSRAVIEVECLSGAQSAQCFYNDRDMQVTWPDGTQHKDTSGNKLNPLFGTTAQTGGGDRIGGGYIHEVILFQEKLSAAERMAVSDWLNQKWQDVTPPSSPVVEVVVAPAATAEVSVARVDAVTGDGVLVKTGAGVSRVRSKFAARGSSSLSYRVEDGALDLGYQLPMDVAAGDVVTVDRTVLGPRVFAPTSGGDPTKLVKTGTGPLTLNRIPDGVRKIEVTGGELVLADPERLSCAVRKSAPPVQATPAAGGTFGFEEFRQETKKTRDYGDGAVAYGWHMVVPATTSGKANSLAFLFDASYGEDKGQSWSLTIGAHEGTCSLGLKNNASAWTEVVFPEDGVYVYTVWVAGRYDQTGAPRKLLLEKDADSLQEFGTLTRTDKNTVFRRFVYTTPFLKAGTYQFWIKGPEEGTADYDKDRCYQYDDMSFVKVADEPGKPYAIPNGDFERWANGENPVAYALASTNKIPGFTVRQAASGFESQAGYGDSTFVANVDGDNYRRFNTAWNRPGSTTQFFMSGEGAELATTFVPPAGTWRLQADSCLRIMTANQFAAYDMEAFVKVGEAADVSLGVRRNTTYKLLPGIWPGSFSVDGETPVTLTIRGKLVGSIGHGNLDNLELVPAFSCAENLLANGGFEDVDGNGNGGDGWTRVVTPKPAGVTVSMFMTYDDSFCGKHFTRDYFEGAFCVKLVNDDTVCTQVEIPRAGLYRLSANFMSRCNPSGGMSFGSGANPVAVYVAKGGVTNWLGVTDSLETTNYCERAFLFRVPEGGAGTYSVGFRGQCVWGGEGAAKVDRTALVDAVMLCPLETSGPIGLPEDLELDLAAGTRLTLDFDGTNTVSRIRINGRRCSGVVSVQTHPELRPYLSGRGALYAEPRGTVIIFR